MINVGIVGCGYWGPKHVRNFHELAEANLTKVCDLDEGRLKYIHEQYPYVKTTRDFIEVVTDNNVDAVVVATPVVTHFEVVRQALLHDKPVLVEKPMTSTSREAAELVEIAESRDLVLMVGHIYDYHPAVEYLSQLVRSGELGEIYSIDAARLNLGLFRADVDVLWDLAPHDLSIVFRLLGQEPVMVSASGGAHIDSDIYDVAYLELVFANGTTAHIHVSWLDPRKVRHVTVVGSKKMVVYDDVSEAEKIRVFNKGLAFAEEEGGPAIWPPRYRYGEVTIPYIPNSEPLKLECQHFIQCVTRGEKPISDGRAGLKIITVLEAARKSLNNGGHRESPSMVTAMDKISATSCFEEPRS